MKSICRYLAEKNEHSEKQEVTGFTIGIIVVLALILLVELDDFIAIYTVSVFFGLAKMLLTFGLIVAVPIFASYLKSSVKSERHELAVQAKIKKNDEKIKIQQSALKEYRQMKAEQEKSKSAQKRGNK